MDKVLSIVKEEEKINLTVGVKDEFKALAIYLMNNYEPSVETK